MTRVITVPGCPEYILYEKKKEENKKYLLLTNCEKFKIVNLVGMWIFRKKIVVRIIPDHAYLF